jgi:hypothetical protein
LDVRPAVSDLEEYGMEQALSRGLTIIINPANVTMVNSNAQDVGLADNPANVVEKASED